LGSELESFVSAQGLLDIASTAGEEAAAAAHIDEGAVIVKQRARTLRHAAQRRERQRARTRRGRLMSWNRRFWYISAVSVFRFQQLLKS
jgi:hypothetical protein